MEDAVTMMHKESIQASLCKEPVYTVMQNGGKDR